MNITTTPNPLYPHLNDTFINRHLVAVDTPTYRITLVDADTYTFRVVHRTTLETVDCSYDEIIRRFAIYEPLEPIVTIDAALAAR